ncbi:HU family DNA-binding protein [Yoonia litorea]|uniref:DNA-binding protein HU-beta n=1 Tax=Yoonia litorea TaxID=1123755 RepID=A0A1I6MC58_9RHOB|nr:HU family DNA-binding protein [Yoonia litorea]SFS13284.1 DNA-binding protein HU-beta [Yoonia litorea]
MAKTPQSSFVDGADAPEQDGQAVGLMKKPDLLDAVVARTNLKKRDVKPAVEAALALIGDALRNGEEVNLPPLGKMRVVKAKDLDGGASVITLKLRTPKNATVAAQTDSAD